MCIFLEIGSLAWKQEVNISTLVNYRTQNMLVKAASLFHLTYDFCNPFEVKFEEPSQAYCVGEAATYVLSQCNRCHPAWITLM